MNKEIYKRISKVERKLENINKLRQNNSTLRIKYEGIKKLLEKKEQENKRLNNILDIIEKYIESKITQCYDEGSTVGEFSKICDILERLQELRYKWKPQGK